MPWRFASSVDQSPPAGRAEARFQRPSLLLRDCGGSVLMEYAFVGPMFLALIIATMNIALIFLAQSAVNTAAEEASRLVMTGQAQNWGYAPSGTSYTAYNTNQGMTATDFKNAVCGKINAAYLPANADPNDTATYSVNMLLPYMNCNDLYINVQNLASFSAATADTSGESLSDISGLLNANGTVNTSKLNYQISTQGQIEEVQMIYLWPTTTAPLGVSFITQANSRNRFIIGTSVLTTESYAVPTQ